MNRYIQLSIPADAAGQQLSAYLAAAGHPVAADCGGRGTCGKCRVQVLSGRFYDRSAGGKPMAPDAGGYIRSCLAFCGSEEAIIRLPVSAGGGLEQFAAGTTTAPAAESGITGVALDIGTTTLAAALVDTATGATLRTVSRLNPQRNFGADVMSRIGAAGKGHLAVMQQVLLEEVRGMLADLTAGMDTRPAELAVVGNTTMLHLFCGVDPSGMGSHPFTPVFLEQKTFSGDSFGLPVERVTVLPSLSAFIGADVTAGGVAVALTKQPQPALLMDIGTNGEMLLFTGTAHGGRLLAASAAAGPAMEGAGISTGVGGIAGAVCTVTAGDDGRLRTKTVGDKLAVGICGSGLIDLIAVLLETGRLDETGYLEAGSVAYAHRRGEALTVTGEDVRAFQLAKGAMRAGLEALAAAAGLQTAAIRTVYLAGGLGYYMRVASAVRVGLLPAGLQERTQSVGNSALGGAAAYLAAPAPTAATMAAMAATCETVDLNMSPVFQEAFMEHMLFPE